MISHDRNFLSRLSCYTSKEVREEQIVGITYFKKTSTTYRAEVTGRWRRAFIWIKQGRQIEHFQDLDVPYSWRDTKFLVWICNVLSMDIEIS